MAAQTLTRGRLRRLADVHPDRGRVLSVFMNLDPSELPTPAARSSAVTSILTEAARRVDDAGELDQDERRALRTDLERVREVLNGDVAADGARGVAVFACEPEDLLEVVALRHPIESRVVLDDAPYVEPLVHAGAAERWCVLLANRRVARLFTGSGDELAETDRIVDDVHRRHEKGGWSQSQLPAQRREGGPRPRRAHRRRSRSRSTSGAASTGCSSAAPDELVGDLEAKLHPYLRERPSAACRCDIEHASADQVRACAAGKIEAFARAAEREALDRLAQGVGSGGRGVAGLADVLDALNEARVEMLLLARGLDAAGLCDPETGLLYATPRGRAATARRPRRSPTSSRRRSRRRSSSPPR